MDKAVPLGIIVNELVSNSLKHTFSGEKEGEIYIALRRSTEYSTLQENNLENYGNTKSRQQKNERTAPNGKIENKEEKLILIVRDDGRGFPEKLYFRNTTSLGLQLVTTLADQIEGKIILDRSRGTDFKISFFSK